MDKNFHDLLVRYVNGRCTPEEGAKVNRWYEQIEDKGLALEEGEKISMRARMLAKIQHELSADHLPSRRHRYMTRLPIYKVAAAVVVFALVGLWFSTGKNFAVERPLTEINGLAGEIVYLNQAETRTVYALPDGSTVQLEPYGRIHFRKKFLEGRREVYLTGNAFFDIVKDLSRPFYVYSGTVATRVLGTSFFVNAPAGARTVEVQVITGSVSVFQVTETDIPEEEGHAAANGVVLSPNEKVKYFMEGGYWVTGLVEVPVPVKPLEEETLSFVFENTSLKEVLANVTERYGIEVMTENENLHKCTFTGDVSKMSLYDMLDVISNAIGSTYEVKGTRILMTGKGCD